MMKKLPIASLNLDFQPEVNLIAETVQRYFSRLQRGDTLKPVTTYYDGEIYRLYDGFHRVKATKLLGRLAIDAMIVHGTLQDMENQWAEDLDALKLELRKKETRLDRGRVTLKN